MTGSGQDPPPPRRRRRGDHVLIEAARGVGLVALMALVVVAVGGLLALVVSWLF